MSDMDMNMTCPVCKEVFPLRANGTYPLHGSERYRTCPASAKNLVDAAHEAKKYS